MLLWARVMVSYVTTESNDNQAFQSLVSGGRKISQMVTGFSLFGATLEE